MNEYEKLKNILKSKIKICEPMKNHISFCIGGNADFFVEPRDLDDLRNIMLFIKERKIDFFIIGNGTNILISDKGIRGVVIKIGKYFSYVRFSGNNLITGAGTSLSSVGEQACRRGLSGIEFVAGIPGTIGGAIVMNAGIQSGSIGNILSWAKIMNTEGDICIKKPESLNFDYRQSDLQKEKCVVIESEFRLEKGDAKTIRKKIDALIQRRRETQPIGKPNAGSVFKNPLGYSAAGLIELAGAKGLRVGNAQISRVHANFIVNLGSATASDVLNLMNKTKEIVYNKFNIELEPEIKIIGEWD